MAQNRDTARPARLTSRLVRTAAAVLLAAPLLVATGCQTSQGGLSFSERMNSLMPGQKKADLQNGPQLYLAYGKWQEHSGNLQAARQAYQIVLQDDAKNIEAMLGEARISAREEQHPAAEEGLRRALALAPTNASVHSAVGQYLLGQKRIAEAVPHLQRAIEIEPSETKHHYHMGVALAKQGDFTNALSHLQQAQGPAKAHYNLGYLLYQAKKYPQATQHFQLALRTDPSLTQAQVMLASMQQSVDPSTQLASRKPRVTSGQLVRQVSASQQAAPVQRAATAPAPAQWPHR